MKFRVRAFYMVLIGVFSIFIGSVCDFRLNYGRVFGSKCKIIAANRNYAQLYKNSDAFWKPALAIQGDSASFVVEVSKQKIVDVSFYGSKTWESWSKLLKEREADKEKNNLVKAEEAPNA